MTHTVHESALLHATGEARYVHDMALRDPTALHAWPVQSTHAHARVTGLDASKALRMPGVRHVLTAADVPGAQQIGPVRHDEPLFPSEVCYHGQPVCWVIADTEATARAAAAQVAVAYEPLPALLTIEAAIAAGSFLTEPQTIETGRPDEEMAAAAHRVSGELRVGGQEHFYLEMQCAYASRDAAGGYHVHSSTQHPTETQLTVAHVLGVPAHEVVCEALRMGGAFGGKETQASCFAAIAALGCLVTGRAVVVRLDRRRDITITGKRHPFLARYEVGFEGGGRLRALRVELFSNGGYSLDLSAAIMNRALFHIDNCYRIEHLRARGRVARTHLPSNTALRGFGGPQAMVIVEEIVDRVARTLGLPVEQVRERNFYAPGDHTHYGQEVRDADRIGRIWRELLASSNFAERRREIAASNARSNGKKRGLAITPVKFGISFTTTHLNQAGASVLVYRDGSVQVNHGGTEMGQGLHTKVRAVAARVLGVPPQSVRLMPTRTDKVPNTSATAASSGSDLNGEAVRRACVELRERIAPVAGQLLGCAPGDVTFADGRVTGGGKQVTFTEVVERAFLQRLPLFAMGFYATPGIHFDAQRGRGEPFRYFACGAAVAEVEVDGFTGHHRLLAVDILHDVGDSLAPLIDRGQIEGGFLQGMGWLTCEEVVFGPDGALRSRGASTYKLPGIGECPEHFVVNTLTRASEPGAVFGSKATGEPPLMLAISVREALRDAVAAFGRNGPVTLGCPATPEAVYWAIHGRPAGM
ncbi:MAG TPA: xanthine dehydrogenase molybdopterin binding subunit [Planctomycetota bacterium]|nr:xanthine dehydrogenase molybdopterin binding subunit [Planctomycetota bacterium]